MGSNQYFHDRAEAGRLLGDQLMKYANQNCAVIALTGGAVIVGAQIAIKLHSSLAILLTEGISLAGEPDPIAAISSGDTFTYNNAYSQGEQTEFTNEFRNYIEEQKITKSIAMHKLVGHEGEIKKDYIKRHTVILVSDGLKDGFSLDVAADFLKPLNINRLIIATPIATVAAMDKMHLMTNEIYCLSVPKEFMWVDHYYQDNTVPDHKGLMQVIRDASLMWSDKTTQKEA